LTSFPRWFHLRTSEWVLGGFFAYIVLLTPFFPERPNLGYQPLIVLLLVFIALGLMAVAERGRFRRIASIIRDWLPIVLTLVAFREMELFLPVYFDHHYESVWIWWDRVFLDQWHLRSIIESTGPLLPFYLELCYVLVYGVAAYCVGVLYGQGERRSVDRFFTVYLTGTLAAYALFPYFPSQPPRFVFSGLDNPDISTWVRRLNLFILSKATIHVGVFPSAHVSSAWAMFLLLPKRRSFGWGLTLYAISVSIATIYGRYHYAADVVAGFAVSLVAAAVCLFIVRKRPKH
jgi:membrane-associated phospholipid phosphatase